jgi:DNA-binding transcriptional ArsR family regulator
MAAPKLFWEIGTAYDLFASQYVLHRPARFGLRGAWARGVRSRLAPKERQMMEKVSSLRMMPLAWLHQLPSPKSGETALQALEALPVEDRFTSLVISPDTPPEVRAVLGEVASQGQWSEEDRQAVREAYKSRGKAPQPEFLNSLLFWAAHTEEFGQRYLDALKSFHHRFFREEEERILPALNTAVELAQEQASRMEVVELLESLSQGVRFSWAEEVEKLVLAPSFWITPLVVYERVGERRWSLLFGARPAEASLVPGELVPDSLIRPLKALSDPTRLRILRYLMAESMTPTQLAKLLRLRAPTVVHHLVALRLAGLVQVTLEAGGEKKYAARPEVIQQAFTRLQGFLRK